MCTDRPTLRCFPSPSSFRRLLAAAGLGLMVLFASAHAVTFTVNVATDSNSSGGGSGTGDTGDLRYVITQAELAANAGSTIQFASTVTGTISLNAALPAIKQNTTITGPGANVLTISGAGKYQVFDVTGGTTANPVAITGLTIADGYSGAGGAGIVVGSGATLHLNLCVIADNADTATSSSPTSGGGILNEGALTVSQSTFYGNSTQSSGGAINSAGASSSVAVTNSTFYGNSALDYAGAIGNDGGTLTVLNSTFDSNSAKSDDGGAIYQNGGTWTLTNSIFANNSAATDGGIYNAGSGTETNNLFFNNSNGDSNRATNSTTDITGEDPLLLPLGNYGGPTPTILPRPTSPAIGKGTGTPATDQRGFSPGSTEDIGAVQTNYTKPTALATTYSANADVDLSGLSSPVSGVATTISGTGIAVNLIGPGADKLTMSGSGNGGNSVFTVDSGAQAAFYGMEITGGGGLTGGGISNAGTTTILDSTITGNSAGSPPNLGKGSGVYNSNGAVLTIIGSTISNNNVLGSGVGGGIYAYGGLLRMFNSTVSGNSAAGGSGGGIDSSPNATVVLTDVTVSNNSAADGGGIYNAGALTLNNSIVEENSATTAPDIDNSIGISLKNNNSLINTGTSASTVNLAGLGSYGGTTPTMLPIPGTGTSAICAGQSQYAVDQYGVPLTTDQRGFAMGQSQSSYCTGTGQIDAGAVQTDYAVPAFTNASSTYGYAGVVNSSVDHPAAPAVQVTENGQTNLSGVPVALTYTGSNALTAASSTALSATTTTGGIATFGSLQSTTTGGGTLTATLQLTPTVTLNSTATPELNIYNAVTLQTHTFDSSTAGTAYPEFDFTTITSNGTGTGYTYAVTSGSLPTGMSLSQPGKLTGTPTEVGTSPYTFTVTATDSDTLQGSQTYSLAVSPVSTSITLGSNPSPSTAGEAVTFTATLSPVISGTAFAKGVSFALDGNPISACSAQQVTVTGSVATATCTVNNLTYQTAPHTITASYPTGDPNYSSANSAALAQTVNLATASVTVGSLATATVDQPETFKATVTGTSTGGVPTGTVSFSIGGTTLCTGTLGAASGNTATASCATSALVANSNSQTVTATYSGGGNYTSSTGTGSLPAVSAAATSVKVTSSGAVGVNQQTVLTATVSPSSPVALSSSGSVTFSDSTGKISGCIGVLITPSTGTATCTTSFLTAATQTISAVYNTGDPNYAATSTANVTTLTQVVNKATTAVALTSSLGTSNVNDSVKFTADVTPYSGTTALPSSQFTNAATLGGTVTFSANGTTLCSGAPSTTIVLTGGEYQATCTVSNLSAGSQSVVASYSGDSNYNNSTGNFTQTVNAIASGITLLSSSPTSTVNQSVTFTADVTPTGKPLALSGSVSFTDNGNAMSCAVGFDKTTGVATCTVANLPLGTNSVTATYAGDTNYTTSNTVVTQTVNQATTSVSVSNTPTSPQVNESVTLTATVTAPSGATQLSGNVSFTYKGAAIAGCTDVGVNPSTAQATCTTSTLPLGTDSIAATYANDTNFAGSTGQVSFTVVPATTTLALVSSATGNASTVNQTVAFTATVSGASGATKFSGKMSFTSDGNTITGCTNLPVDPATGVAVCSTTALTAGAHTIAATYAGDLNFAGGTTTIPEHVTAASSSMRLTSLPNPSIAANPKNVDDVVSLTATVSPSNGGVSLSGTVAFTDNGVAISGCTAVPVNATTGAATCPASFTSYGTHSIVAVYGNDSNYTSSQGTATQEVQDYQLAASPTAAVGVTQGYTNANDPFTPQNITVAATPFGGFTGNLALTCTVAAVTAPQGAVLPTCSLGNSTLSIASGSTPQPVTLTVNTGSGSNVASPGTYNVSVTGVDATTGLTHTTAAFTVYVRYDEPSLSLVSGATTGNTSSLNFILPASVGITSFQCATVTGPTLSVSVNPSGLGIGCTFTPGSITAANTVQSASTTVAISTNVPLSQAMLNHNSKMGGGNTAVEVAGMVGVPLFMLLGFLPGARRTRRIFFRCLGIVFVAVLLFGGVSGCGGGSFTQPKSVSGTTPPGTYNVLVQGTGTDGHMYEAVVTINVTR